MQTARALAELGLSGLGLSELAGSPELMAAEEEKKKKKKKKKMSAKSGAKTR